MQGQIQDFERNVGGGGGGGGRCRILKGEWGQIQDFKRRGADKGFKRRMADTGFCEEVGRDRILKGEGEETGF